MDDALFVCCVERLSDLFRDGQCVVERYGTLRDAVGQSRTLDQLHHQTVRGAGVFDAVDVRDIRMIQRREHLRLAVKPCEPLGIRRHDLREHLDGYVAIQLRVVRPVDLTHPSGAELGADFIRTDPSSWTE